MAAEESCENPRNMHLDKCNCLHQRASENESSSSKHEKKQEYSIISRTCKDTQELKSKKQQSRKNKEIKVKVVKLTCRGFLKGLNGEPFSFFDQTPVAWIRIALTVEFFNNG